MLRVAGKGDAKEGGAMRVMLSLRERLSLLVVAAVLPLAAVATWFGLREMRAAQDDARAQLEFAASLVAASQDRVMEAADHLLGAIAAMEGLRDPGAGGCERYFEALRVQQPVYANVGVLDLRGDVRCHAQANGGSFNAADRPYFARAVREKRFVMGAPVLGRASGRYVIPFARPILEGDAVVGVAFAALDLQAAGSSLGRLPLPPSARVVLTDRQGAVLLAHPPQPAGLPAAAPARIAQAAASLARTSGEFTDNSGQFRIFASAPSRNLAGEGFLAVVSLARDEVASHSLASLRGELLAMMAMLLAGLAAAWVIGGRAIVKPTKQILGAVRKLEQGSLDARVPLTEGPHRGEFARIGAAFNLMAESLQLRQVDLENELGRSRAAYAVLDQVLNSMHEALIAMDEGGRFLLHNQAARALFPLEGPFVESALRPRAWGMFRADGSTYYPLAELPLERALRGESGHGLMLLVRNEQVPAGRLLHCSYQPLRGEGGATAGLAVFSDVTELQRLQAEQAAQFDALRDTQRKLVEAQRIGRLGNWEVDLVTGEIWWSDEVYQIAGLTPGKFRPTLASVPSIVHPEDVERHKAARDAVLRDGKVMDIELRFLRPDGQVIWVHQRAEARRNSAGEPVWYGGVVQDITARKRDEQALRERESELHDYTQMLQRAAAAAQSITALPTLEETMQRFADEARRVIPSHLSVVSLGEGGPAQTILAVSMSDKYAKWRGLQGAPDGTGLYSVVTETLRPLRLTHDEMLAHPRWRGFSGQAAAHPPIRGLLAVPLIGRNGGNLGLLQLSDKEQGDFTEREEYVAVELAQLAAIAIENAHLFTEITQLNAGLEARIAERTAALTQQERLYRTLAEQAPEIVWNTDASGKATFLNHAWYDLVGGTPEQWLGTGWLERIHPEDRESVQQNWLRSRDTLQPYTGTRRIQAHDGRYHTMSYRAGPVLDESGQVTFWVGIDADITALKAIEQALRSSNQELEAFSYSVSHDLRAPLGAIAGFSRALATKLEGQLDERSTHYLARIQAGVVKMEQLIDALLSLARVARAPLDWGTVDLSAMAREITDELQVQQPDRRVTVDIAVGLQAQGDARLLRLLMQNLLGNAWKFSAQRDDARIDVGRSPDGSYFVRDNGVGFDMAYSGKLFVAFQRLHTEAEFPGTGIGLATVRRITARHHGKVWAESVPGEGTVFYFTLPDIAPPTWLGGASAAPVTPD